MPDKTDILAKAEAWLHRHAEEMASDLADFTRIRSVSRADLATHGAPFGVEAARMLEFALFRGAAYGFEVKNRDGFYGKISLGDDDRAIGMISHLDVVPEGVNWIHPPFGAVREGDFMFGRGVRDNKAALTAALYVMRMVKELDIPLKHGLRLILGCSEETGMQDMRAYNQNEKPCDVTLVPDSAFPVCYAQKGSLNAQAAIPAGAEIARFHGGEVDNMVPPTCECALRLPYEDVKTALEAAGFSSPAYEVLSDGGDARVIAHGVASHAAKPEAGLSAIHMLSTALSEAQILGGDSARAMRAISFLSQGNFGEHAGIACEDEDTGKTTMVVGVARTDNGEIEVHVDCRLSAKADIAGNRAAMRECLESRGFQLLGLETTPPVFISRDDARVLALQAAYRAVTGDDRAPYTMGGGTYSRCLKDAITFGIALSDEPRPEGLPQGHGGAHAPDEFTHLPSLRKSALIYLMAVMEMDKIV